jgi:hypothetical protein
MHLEGQSRAPAKLVTRCGCRSGSGAGANEFSSCVDTLSRFWTVVSHLASEATRGASECSVAEEEDNVEKDSHASAHWYHQQDSRARAWGNGLRGGLKENLSARLGNRRRRTAQIRGSLMTIPSQARRNTSREGVETRRQHLTPELSGEGEGIVQTANLPWALKGGSTPGRRKP